MKNICFTACLVAIIALFYSNVFAQVPANDDCSGAINLSIAPNSGACNPTLVNTINATQSPYYSTSCSSYSHDDDVWYKFTANATSVVLSITNISNYNEVGYSVISFYCPGNGGYELTCGYSYGGTNLITGLSAGSTYYICVFFNGSSYRGTFDMCLYNVPPPPGNDECINAVSLTVGADFGECNTVTANASSATASNYYSCYGSNYYNDVWYKFVATADTLIINISNKDLPTYTAGFTLLSGSCTGYALQCSDDYNGPVIPIYGLIAGQTYYLSVYYTGGMSGSFDFCIYPPAPPPPNDNCSSAITLNVSDCIPAHANTNGATMENYLSYCWFSSYDDGIWYRFTAQSENMFMDITNLSVTDFPVGWSLFADSCPAFNFTEVQCNVSFGGRTVLTNLVRHHTYYLCVFYAGNTERGTFDICVHTPPPPPANDNCSGAYPVTVNKSCSPTHVNTEAATRSPNYYSLCWSDSYDDDIWYQFIAPADTVYMNISNKSVAKDYVGWSLFPGDCSSREMLCGDDYYSSTDTLTGLTAGQTYFLNVFYADTIYRGSFDFCLTSDKSILFPKVSNDADLIILPNPVLHSTADHSLYIKLKIETQTSVTSTLSGMRGERVYNTTEPAAPGDYINAIDMSQLSAGVYLLQIATDQSTFNRKIVVE